jgi:hypothetical protein
MRFSYVTNPVFLAYSLRKKVVSIIIHIILGSSGEIADKIQFENRPPTVKRDPRWGPCTCDGCCFSQKFLAGASP